MKGRALLGVLGGLAVGAIIGVLLAPDKGSKTRKAITDKRDDYLDGLKDKLDSLKDKYDELLEEVGDKYEAAKKAMK